MIWQTGKQTNRPLAIDYAMHVRRPIKTRTMTLLGDKKNFHIHNIYSDVISADKQADIILTA